MQKGLKKFECNPDDHFHSIQKYLTTINPMQYEVPKYISKYSLC